jgi:Concanavalin A-like lectin/glucanases superfamily
MKPNLSTSYLARVLLIIATAMPAFQSTACSPGPLDAIIVAPSTLGSGLVAHWDFDEGSGSILNDQSGNRRQGTISGGTWTQDGRFGGALHLQRGDNITVENFPDATPNWTLSAWIRLNEEDRGISEAAVMSAEIWTQGGWELHTYDISPGPTWHFAYWTGPNGEDYARFDCACLTNGVWTHVTAVFDANAGRLFLYNDAVLRRTMPVPPSPKPGSPTLFFGKWTGPGRPFAGSLDDIAVYNRALSDVEVAELHERPPPAPDQ